jgi:hypothetical protein
METQIMDVIQSGAEPTLTVLQLMPVLTVIVSQSVLLLQDRLVELVSDLQRDVILQ